jgi:deazaflavin-dependent oxidoreductase (nitroreductase family)
MVTAPICDDDRVVLVASNAGDYRQPAWYLNVLADPVVHITFDGMTWQARARVATAAERAQLWPTVVAANSGYAQYQDKTEREIPLVIVEPRGNPDG